MKSSETWSSAALRVYSKSMSVAEISNALGTAATSSHPKGVPVSLRNPNSPIREESLWVLDSGLNHDQPLEDHIKRLVEYIEQKSSILNTLLPHCEVELFCGFSTDSGQGGFAFEPDLLKKLTILPLVLIFDIYSLGGPEENIDRSSDNRD